MQIYMYMYTQNLCLCKYALRRKIAFAKYKKKANEVKYRDAMRFL